MDNQKLKILRNKISVPLNVAIELLKKNNGDVLLCEQEFHTDNIRAICASVECDYDTAKKSYEVCNYDIAKAIEKVNQKQVILTTGKTTDSKIGFILWPENANGEFYKTVKRNDAFIPTEDFDLILKAFQSVFPMKNPWNNEIENEFDVLGHNYFDNKTCKEIVQKISQIQSCDKTVKTFLEEIINWINDKLSYAESIVVYGNL